MLLEEKDELGIMTPSIELIIGVLAIFIFGLIGAGVASSYASWASGGAGLQEVLKNITTENTLLNRNIIRYSNFIVHLFSFSLASIIIARLVSKQGWVKYLKLNRIASFRINAVSVVLIVASLPLIAITYWVNMQLPLPTWATSMESETNAILDAMLTMDSPMELMSNLLIMAVVPAIGEELLFRGIILQFFEKYFKKEHLAVWITAFVFSAIHMQFEGFIPRFLLGAVLGYLFIWSRSIWTPIIAHFFFNGSQVAAKYFSDVDLETQNNASPQWSAGFFSLVLCVFLIQYLYKKRVN